MKKSKLVSLMTVCAAVLAIGVAGCGSKSSSSDKSTTTKDGKTNISIMAPILSSQPPAKDSKVLTGLEKLTNSKLDINWVASSSYSDKESVLMASGDLPDIMVFTAKDNTYIKSVKAGAFWNLTKYVKDYPNLQKYITKQAFKNVSLNGQIYGIPRARDLSRTGFTYRQDWLDKLGLKVPETIDDWQNVITAFATKDPDGNGKNDTYGYIDYGSSAIANLAVMYGAPFTWGQKDDGTFYPAFETSAYMKAMDFFKKNVKAGYINPDWSTGSNTATEDQWYKGRGGSLFGYDALSKMATKQPIAELAKRYVYGGALKASASSKTVYTPATPGYAGLLAIPKQTVKTEAQLKKILTFIDKISSKEGQILMNNGIENVNFKAGDKTQYVSFATPINPTSTETKQIVNDCTSMAQIGTGGGAYYKSIDKNLQSIVKNQYKIIASDTKHVVSNPAEQYLSDTYAQKGATLNTIMQDATVNYVSGKLDKKGFQAAIDLWKKSGGDKIIKEYTAAAKKADK